MKNKVFNTAVIIISAGVFLSFFILSNGLNSLLRVMKKADVRWILAAFLCMIGFWLMETLIIYIITKGIYNIHNLFVKSLKFAMIGQFFGAITPFASGMQIAQMYGMAENDIPSGPSGSILMIKFIIHQTTLTFYSLIVIIFGFNYFNVRIPYLLYFCLFGFLFNSSLIFFAILFSINRKITARIFGFVVFISKKIRIIKNPEEGLNKIQNEILSFHENAAVIAKNKRMCFLAFIFTFLQWTFFYSVPYFIYRSFGLSSAGIFIMIAAEVYLTMFMSCIPLPGAAGGAEGGFYMIFSIFFGKAAIMPAIFIWRIITYYSCIGAGSIFTVVLPDKRRDKKAAGEEKNEIA